MTENNTWRQCISPASFWRPDYSVDSAWLAHGPFAFWLVEAARPRLLVELGTHRGFSYAAFCQAIARLNYDTKAFAVDTWRGDEHAGFYGDEIFGGLSAYHDRHYSGFSSLLRMTFDEAVGYFEDGSIDLLHIDGRHRYDDVKHDFEQWSRKLSDRAIVLFHDTNVREREFGVFRFWSELAKRHPHFEFPHGHGLGVLAPGSSIPEGMRALFECGPQPDQATSIRQAYANLGNVVRDDWIARTELAAARADLDSCRRQIEELGAEIATATQISDGLESTTGRLRDQLAALSDAESRAKTLAETARTQGNEIARLHNEIHQLRSSRSWRLTRPLRSRPAQAAFRLVRGAKRRARKLVAGPAAPAFLARPATSAKLRVLFLSGEAETPGHIYRVIRGAAAARRWGADVVVDTIEDLSNERAVSQFDVLWIWRAPWTERIGRLLDEARRSNVKIVFDIDDLMIDPTLARPDIIDAIRSQRLDAGGVAQMYERIASTFALADYGVAPTTFLAQYMRRYEKPAFVLKNTFDTLTLEDSRNAARRRRLENGDGLQRIGYAGGTRTHQEDFRQAAEAIARVLKERPQCRLVLFSHCGEPILDPHEYPEFVSCMSQIEWREAVPLAELPKELARFDINLAPLVAGNPFCEAKSELKYFEAALANVPTIASRTQAFAEAITPGVTGYLADSPDDWHAAIITLLDDDAHRARVTEAAFLDVIGRYGPDQHADNIGRVLEQVSESNARKTQTFTTTIGTTRDNARPVVPGNHVVLERDRLGQAAVCVVIPLYNYEKYITEALDSVASQTLDVLDLVVVDDASTDNSLSLAEQWITQHLSRFNRVLLCRNDANSGLALTRNAAFARAETQFVLPLDADNILLPNCAETLLKSIEPTSAAFVYPEIQRFGDSDEVFGVGPFDPNRLMTGNYIDAMALVRKSAWAQAGGYDHIRYGWEDFDFWCKFVERGLWGQNVPQVLARYRVHGQSMLRTETDLSDHKKALIANLQARHPWLQLQG